MSRFGATRSRSTGLERPTTLPHLIDDLGPHEAVVAAINRVLDRPSRHLVGAVARDHVNVRRQSRCAPGAPGDTDRSAPRRQINSRFAAQSSFCFDRR